MCRLHAACKHGGGRAAHLEEFVLQQLSGARARRRVLVQARRHDLMHAPTKAARRGRPDGVRERRRRALQDLKHEAHGRQARGGRAAARELEQRDAERPDVGG